MASPAETSCESRPSLYVAAELPTHALQPLCAAVASCHVGVAGGGGMDWDVGLA